MRQSTLIFGTLMFAFVVYITSKGQLPSYLALFKRKETSDSSSNGSNESGFSLPKLSSLPDIGSLFGGSFDSGNSTSSDTIDTISQTDT